ncbi:reverse transcriptase [Corchorus capsularis]|uniref:Reverse transcriptase n=1 Tax=Corchorus capsularis TaxID=210143 RepID=A0A1R3I9W8_COCAP|nr:reverse transcriptase [Corchorus capsularis]
MPPKPKTVPDEVIAQVTAAVAAQLQELQISLDSKYASLDARYTVITSAITEQNSSIYDQVARLDKAASATPPSALLTAQTLAQKTPSSSQFPSPPDALHIKSPKIHLSTFDGTNPLDWLFQAEQYFSFHAIAPEQRLPLVAFYMSGLPLSWFKWMHRNNQLSDWASFASALERRFGPSSYFNHEAALFKLKQTSFVAHYRGEFEKLANKVDGLSTTSVLNCFVGGLLPQIQREMSTLKPQNLSEAGDCAALIEEKLADSSSSASYPVVAYSRAPLPKPTLTLPQPKPPLLSTLPKLPPPSQPKPISAMPIKRLSPTEMQARRAKGLCFNCDDQYKPGHWCRTAPLLLLQTEDEPDSPLESADPAAFSLASIPLPPPPDMDETDPSSFHVSLHALDGSSSYQTMKMIGYLMGHKVRVLIDSGSTHNLIQPRVARLLGLRLEPAPPFSVVVGNGDRLSCSGKIPSINIGLQGHGFTLDLFLLDIWGAEVVLGVQWLSRIGPFLTDYKALIMTFYDTNGHLVTLHGDKPAQISLATCQQLKRLTHTGSIISAHLLTLSEIKSTNASPFLVPEALQALLTQFQDLFAEPQGLPPFRMQSHHIHLQPGTKPINQQSRIAFLYQLIDELHGARVFSKLDLQAGYHQIRVALEDVHKTAFRTADSHYEFLVMPFGLTNAPSTFQAIMNDVFRPYLRQFVLVFFDDILVYSPSMETHSEHLRIVLQLLAHHQFYVKLSKCSFGQTSIDYLGHVIGDAGVHVEPSKISAVTAWPTPTNLKTLRGFLGLTGYYRKFVKNYAHIAAPLTNLLRKDNFLWTSEAANSFQALKEALTSAPVLALPDFELPFAIEADASNVAIGAVLTQAGHPIAYFMLSYLDELREFYATNVQGQQILTKANSQSDKGFSMHDGLVFFRGRVVIPEGHALQLTLLQEYHASLIGGHAGVKKTLARLAANFYWPKMRQSIEQFIQACSICQQVKYEATKPGGLSTPLPIPSQIWQDISMDFITHLPSSYDKTDIWVIVDRLSKYAHFIALPPSYTASSLAEIFCKDFCKLHGMPTSIVSDRDPKFLSAFWKELFKLQGTQLFHSSAYHPQSDGQSEVLNRCLETYLRSFASDKPKQWTKFLHWAEYSYNTSKHSATGYTPFEAVYGRPPPTVLSYLPGTTKVVQLDASLLERQQLLSSLKTNLARAQNRMKMQYDQNRPEKQFNVGEWVFLRLQPYRQMTVHRRSSQKLAKRFFGPFQILRKLGPVAYELKLPIEAKIHPVFHVSLLKKCYGSPEASFSPLPSTFVNDQPVLEPSAILDTRQTVSNGVAVTQYLIQWKNLATTEATWEWKEDMKANYPLFNLEDKVALEDHGNDGLTLRSKSSRPKIAPVWTKDYELSSIILLE